MIIGRVLWEKKDQGLNRFTMHPLSSSNCLSWLVVLRNFAANAQYFPPEKWLIWFRDWVVHRVGSPGAVHRACRDNSMWGCGIATTLSLSFYLSKRVSIWNPNCFILDSSRKSSPLMYVDFRINISLFGIISSVKERHRSITSIYPCYV